ncbi:MAG: hypothetical protein O3B74_07245, partial [Proteobacteria bacterium]|nr:hypothetical protein [Pseudomonadota bacterium]
GVSSKFRCEHCPSPSRLLFSNFNLAVCVRDLAWMSSIQIFQCKPQGSKIAAIKARIVAIAPIVEAIVMSLAS